MATEHADVYEYRPLLFSIAYRMLGEKQEAEDIVQDIYTRWLEMDVTAVQQPRHYLMRATTNRSINRLKSLQQQRETYPGPWLPEPATALPELAPAQEKDLSIGFLFLLEKLNPVERAVFLLRESFDVPYKELESILDIPETNCRQHYHRAKEKLQQEKKRFDPDAARHQQLIQAFMDACMQDDQSKLVSLLKEDISFYADGGGKASSAGHPLFGQELVSKFILGIFRKLMALAKYTWQVQWVNGQPAMVFFLSTDEPPLLCACFEQENGHINSFYFIRNPDKLKDMRYYA